GPTMAPRTRLGALALVVVFVAIPTVAAVQPDAAGDASPIPASETTGWREPIERFVDDWRALRDFYRIDFSPRADERLGAFLSDWQSSLDRVDFDALDHDAQIDYLLLRNHIEGKIAQRRRERALHEEIQPLIPFADPIVR